MNNIKKRIFTSLILLVLLFLIMNSQFLLTYTLIVFSVTSIIEFIKIIKKIFKNKISILILNFIFIFYIFIFCSFFFILSSVAQFKILLLIFLLGCITSDIGGYVFGKYFNGPKLTKISPNKTFAGAIGSLILASISISLMLFFANIEISWKIIIVTLLTSISCQIGDLFFSYLKRKAKLKDTGNLLPGHGGVLDRFDGILLGVPIGFIIFSILY